MSNKLCVLILSLSSKAPHVNNGGGNESLMEEVLVPWRDGMDGERQRDTDTREPDVVDVTTAAAEINNHHRGSADKYKFSTFGYQVSSNMEMVAASWIRVRVFKYCAYRQF